MEFQGAVAAGQTLLFRPPGGTALIDHPESFSGMISGFTGPSDRIDLTRFGPTGASAALDADDRLVVTNGSQSVSLQLDTALDYVGITWQTGADAAGTGTHVAPVCFCRGTLILTDRGEMPVESLAVGDRVKTLSGTFKPIVWIGFGRELLTVANKLARPVIVRQGALADGVPKRDLYLTHGHALYLNSAIGGVLIPVENLVNHRTILWDERAQVVECYHVELEDHDVLLAEGAPAESYYDAGNRASFQNTRPGSAAGGNKPMFAPVLDSGAIVEDIWARLFARAGGGSTLPRPTIPICISSSMARGSIPRR